MQAGFAMLCAGHSRGKNIQNILAKNLADCAVGTIAFFVVGCGPHVLVRCAALRRTMRLSCFHAAAAAAAVAVDVPTPMRRQDVS